MKVANDLGLVAEAITLDELASAERYGFDPKSAILNGPAKWWPESPAVECRAFFADSVAELTQLRTRIAEGRLALTCQVVGLRVAPSGVESRFGISLGDLDEVTRATELIAELCQTLEASWGVHFHSAESVVGWRRWAREAVGALRLTDLVAARIGTPPSVVDLGGGWDYQDLPRLGPMINEVIDATPGMLRDDPPELVLEPGKLLTQSVATVYCRVLVVRHPSEEVVVDATLGELSEARARVHPVSVFRDGEWRTLGPGDGRILGRSCMEEDVLRSHIDISDLREEDLLTFGMAGAYDLSMAYPFGRGQAAEV